MKETREEYQIKITEEISRELKLDINKEYNVEEINVILKKYGKMEGILKFVPSKPYFAKNIIKTLVDIDMRISDGIHNVLGFYGDEDRCEYCNGLFIEEKMFEVTHDGKCVYLCEDCRRKNKIKIGYSDFRRRIPVEGREFFIYKELEFGIDYLDYIEK